MIAVNNDRYPRVLVSPCSCPKGREAKVRWKMGRAEEGSGLYCNTVGKAGCSLTDGSSPSCQMRTAISRVLQAVAGATAQRSRNGRHHDDALCCLKPWAKL